MSPFGHGHHEDRVSTRALILTPVAGPGAGASHSVTLAIETPDGHIVVGTPDWLYRDYVGVLGVGRWVPVTFNPSDPSATELDTDRVPYDSDVAEVIAEALGGPAVDPVTPDPWRTQLALQYAEQVITQGGLAADQADAVRTRIRAGI